jgi:outer membrane protein OmpA-like peptidoglycan-associated protein
MRQQSPRARKKGFPWLVLLAALLVAAGAVGVGIWRWEVAQEQARIRAAEIQHRAAEEAEKARLRAAELKRWSHYIDRLRGYPGIVVAEATERGGKFIVSGLRDPLAADPAEIMREAGVDPARVVSYWQPYQALEPSFVLQRLEASLKPPASVVLQIYGDRIVAIGSATPVWLSRARAAAGMLPAGGPTLDVSRVQDLTEEVFGNLRAEIQAHEIRFNTNESLPAPGQEEMLDQLASQIKELTSLGVSMHMAARVRLTGHSDDTGPGTYNLSLSIARAGAVLALLKKRGVAADLITIGGAGQLDPLNAADTDAARSTNRRVSVAAWLEDQP